MLAADLNLRPSELTSLSTNALFKLREKAAFDELRQGIKDIDFLSDPKAGELKIGCPASVLGGTLSLAAETLRRALEERAHSFAR